MTSSYFSELPGISEARAHARERAMAINAAAPKTLPTFGRSLGVGSENECLLDRLGDGFFAAVEALSSCSCWRRGAQWRAMSDFSPKAPPRDE